MLSLRSVASADRALLSADGYNCHVTSPPPVLRWPESQGTPEISGRALACSCEPQFLVAQRGCCLGLHGLLDGSDAARAGVLYEIEHVLPEARLPAALQVVEAEYKARRVLQF